MSINTVTLSGRVSQSPKRVQNPDNGGDCVYVFPLAVHERNGIVFPVVVTDVPPKFVTYYDDGRKLHQQPLVTVVGRIRTRNLTHPLGKEVAAQAQRGGVSEETIVAIREAVRERLGNLDLEVRRVVTEVMADSIQEGGVW